MRLHALQSMYEERTATEVNSSSFGDDRTFHDASRPESMSHRAPGPFGIRSKVAFSILAHLKSWCSPCHLQIHDAGFIRCRFDRIGGSILAEVNSTIISVEAKLSIVETMVIQSVGGPQIWSLAVGVVDLGVEVARSPDAAGHVRDTISLFTTRPRPVLCLCFLTLCCYR